MSGVGGRFRQFPELKREQYFAVNSKGEVFLETLMRYGNRYQEDKRAAINSLFGGANVVDIATPEIPQGVERWGDLERLNKERDLVGMTFPPIRWMSSRLCWITSAIPVWQIWKIRRLWQAGRLQWVAL